MNTLPLPPTSAAPNARRPGDGWALVLLTALTALLAVPLLKPGIALDGICYFAYLRSAAQDGDLDLKDELTNLAAGREDFNMTAEGHVRNVFPLGSAVLWLPFYLAGHADALLLHRLTGEDVAAGYSRVHVLFVYVAAVCIGLAALVVCARFAAGFAGRGPALHATLAVWLASPFVYYQYLRGDYSHVPSALCVALFVIAWHEGRNRPRLAGHLLLGFLGGLAAMVRWQDLLLLVLPLSDLGRHLAARVLARLRRHDGEWRLGPLALRWAARTRAAPAPAAYFATPGHGLAFLFGLLAGAAPQLVYWRVTLGEWFAVPQGKGFLIWNRPEVAATLFSSYHGLFAWHPLLLVAVAGLLLLARREPGLVLPLLLLFALETYMNSIVSDWEAGISFGGRRFVGLTVLFVLGLGRVYRAVGPLASSVLTAAATLANFLLLYEFDFGLISRRWYVSYREILAQHAHLVGRIGEVASGLAADPLGRQWPRATWVVLGPAALLLALTALVLWGERRGRSRLRALLLALLLVSQAAFVGAAVVSRPAPADFTRVGDFTLIDFRWYENSHYQLDPFHPDFPGRRHFLGLAGKTLRLAVPGRPDLPAIPFEMLDPLAEPLENACALTTCLLDSLRAELALAVKPTRAVWLAVDGGVLGEHPDARAGRLEIVYADGGASGQDVTGNRDVWDYWNSPPEDRILWRGSPPADLTWLRVAADSTRIPRALRVAGAGPLANRRRSSPPVPGFTIFAATQECTDGTTPPVSIAARANTDFMQDPFRPDYAPNHFPHLEPGVRSWHGVPFEILDVDPVTGRGTVITTAYQPEMRLKIPLAQERTERVYLVVDGAGIHDLPYLYLGDVLVHYDSGDPTVIHVESRVNVWDYWEDPDEALLAWRGSDLETLSVLEVATDAGRTPRCLEIKSAGAIGNKGIVAGFAVFAITQKLAVPPS